MRYVILLIALVALPAEAGAAVQHDQNFSGMWISTPFPALRLSAEEPIRLPISVHNSGPRPERVNVVVDRAPAGWTTSLMGDGHPVSAVFVDPKSDADLNLHITPSENAKEGTYAFRIEAKDERTTYDLPIEVTLGKVPPAKLTLKPEFPGLKGASGSDFTFKLTLKNDSGHDALVNLQGETPSGFETTFTKEFGSQQITSVPVKAGDSQSIEAKIKPPQGIKADTYKVRIDARSQRTDATADLTMTVTGRPELSLSGPDDRVSGRAYAGEETPLTLVVANNGTAPAQDVKLASTEPSGWKVQFDQKKIGMIEPGQRRQVKALITPSRQAVAGDYMVTMRANGDSGSDSSSDFRITVQTSTIWGSVGIAVIAAAVLVLVIAMKRYGRR